MYRYEGQVFYIQIVFLGVCCCLPTVLLLLFLSDTEWYGLHAIGHLLTDFRCWLIDTSLVFLTGNEAKQTAENLSFFLVLSGMSLAFAWAWVLFEEIRLFFAVYELGSRLRSFLFSLTLFAKLADFSNKRDIYLNYQILKDSPLDKLFFLSFLYDEYLTLRLENRKVYVGRVIDLGEPNNPNAKGEGQEIVIVPIMSGYRKEDTLEIVFTTFYSEKSEPITLRQDKIMSASVYDPDDVDAIYLPEAATDKQ